MPEPIILPTIFNELLIVDALETNKLVKLVLLNIDVDVLFKLLIDNIELVDNLFKLLKVVVDVLFKLLIDNIEFVDILFKLLKIVVDHQRDGVCTRVHRVHVHTRECSWKFVHSP